MDSEEILYPPVTWPIEVRLKTPIEFGSQRIDTLTFRRGRMADMKGIKLAEISTESVMLAASRLSGQPLAVIERIDEDDAGRVNAIALRFLQKCLQIANEP